MPPVSAPTMMSASVWASCLTLTSPRHALLDELEKRVVQGETTLNAVPRGGQHLGDHLAIGIAAGALVPQGVVVPLRSLVAGVPGSV
jgi:hypothetical protein